MRLLPGEGELPLKEIIAVLPADVPVSVEAPNLPLWQQMGDHEFCRRDRRAATSVPTA